MYDGKSRCFDFCDHHAVPISELSWSELWRSSTCSDFRRNEKCFASTFPLGRSNLQLSEQDNNGRIKLHLRHVSNFRSIQCNWWVHQFKISFPLNNWNLIFSASHCIQDKHEDKFSNGYRRLPSHIIVYFGMFDLKNIRNSTSLDIEEIYLNADWSPINESYDADIALLKLRNTVIFSKIISPICLWPTLSNEFAKGTVISWTDPDESDPGYWNHDYDPLHNYAQQFTMPIRSNTQCLLMQPRFQPLSSKRTFCAGGLNSGQCLEVGNSGASMAVEVDGKFYLQGIVSASFIDIMGCDNITFTLFTNALSFKKWIIERIDAWVTNLYFVSCFHWQILIEVWKVFLNNEWN